MELDGDPYDIGVDDRFRPLVKETLNRLLNGKRRPFPYTNPGQGIVFDEANVGLSWAQFLNLIRDRFEAVSDQFSSGAGLQLQRLDSDIAQAVMLEANTLKVPMLPIHDSFIVRLSDYPDLVRAMERAMRETVGIKIPIKITGPQPSDLSLRLSKHWEHFDSYDPSQDNPPEPELTNQLVPGYEGYQRRVGQMIKEQHRRVLELRPTKTFKDYQRLRSPRISKPNFNVAIIQSDFHRPPKTTILLMSPHIKSLPFLL